MSAGVLIRGKIAHREIGAIIVRSERQHYLTSLQTESIQQYLTFLVFL